MISLKKRIKIGLFFTGCLFFLLTPFGMAIGKTPSEIEEYCHRSSMRPDNLVYASRMSAKVDNTALQDGYQLYHHIFCFTKKGSWTVIQQGMNQDNRYARRYHWMSEGVEDFVCEPHQAICFSNTTRSKLQSNLSVRTSKHI